MEAEAEDDGSSEEEAEADAPSLSSGFLREAVLSSNVEAVAAVEAEMVGAEGPSSLWCVMMAVSTQTRESGCGGTHLLHGGGLCGGVGIAWAAVLALCAVVLGA